MTGNRYWYVAIIYATLKQSAFDLTSAASLADKELAGIWSTTSFMSHDTAMANAIALRA
jgi:hypothetical protein